MRISNKAVIQSLIVAVGLFISQPILAETIHLFGKIGDFPIGASLDRDEEQLTGWYFYQSRAKKIAWKAISIARGPFVWKKAQVTRRRDFRGSVSRVVGLAHGVKPWRRPSYLCSGRESYPTAERNGAL